MNAEAKAKRDALKAEQSATLDEVLAFWEGRFCEREHLEKLMADGLWEATFNPPQVAVCPDCGRTGCQLGYVKGHPVRGLPGGFCEFSISMIAGIHGPKAADNFPLTVEEYMRPIIERRERDKQWEEEKVARMKARAEGARLKREAKQEALRLKREAKQQKAA